MHEPERDNAGVIAPPPLIYLSGLAAGYLLHRIMPLRLLPSGLARVAGGALVMIGVVPAVTALATMRRANTRVEPWEPTTAIVSDGPFRYTRNPIYLSFTLIYMGIAAILNSLTVLLPLPIVLFLVQRGVIEREEAYLERKFGAAYTAYKDKVRRWL